MLQLIANLTALFATAATVATAAPYTPEALLEVGHRAAGIRASGGTPLVVFDLDDTLTDSRTRTVAILHELAHEPATPSDAAGKLERLSPADIGYDLRPTLRAAGVADADVLSRAESYWKARFFSDAYVRLDEPIKGAPEYARWLASQGARLVYLTGRPEETMHDGTVANLTSNGFPPLGDGQAVLIMKPHAADDDLAFKTAAFAQIAALGSAAGVFENEPRNINALHHAFPGAVAVFLDTIHSSRPDQPDPEIAWVRDFDYGQ